MPAAVLTPTLDAAGAGVATRRATLGAAIAAVAVHGALWWIELRPSPRPFWGDEATYWAASERLRAGAPAALEPLWPPLYPHFLALVSRLSSAAPLVAVKLVQLALLVAAALLLRRAWIAVGGTAALGTFLAAWLIADPSTAAFTLYLWPEILHLFLVAAALWVLATGRRSAAWLVALGLALGLALLAKALLLPFLPVLLAPLALEKAAGERWRRVAVVAAVVAVTVAPAAALNWRHHRLLAPSGSGLFNLWVGMNDVSRASLGDNTAGEEFGPYLASGATFAERQRVLRAKIAARVAERGVAALAADALGRQYFRLFDRDSFLTDQLPGGRITAYRLGYVDPPPALAGALRTASYLSYAAMLALAAGGAVLATPRQRPWLWIPMAFLGYNLSILLFLHVKSRYRLQLVWVLLALAGVAVGRWREAGGWQGLRARCGRLRLAAAASAAALALFLVFAGPSLDAASGRPNFPRVVPP
jgi:hypothetical protein